MHPFSWGMVLGWTSWDWHLQGPLLGWYASLHTASVTQGCRDAGWILVSDQEIWNEQVCWSKLLQHPKVRGNSWEWTTFMETKPQQVGFNPLNQHDGKSARTPWVYWFSEGKGDISGEGWRPQMLLWDGARITQRTELVEIQNFLQQENIQNSFCSTYEK